jgi:hypothetical protein
MHFVTVLVPPIIAYVPSCLPLIAALIALAGDRVASICKCFGEKEIQSERNEP